jgi:hypothetical protein
VGTLTLFGAIAFTMAVLWPRQWTFSGDPRVLAGEDETWRNRDDADAVRWLAYLLGEHYEANQPRLRQLWFLVEASLLLTALSIAAWLWLLLER